MASLITVRLNKADAPSLGFRLQGGKDFGTPLVIQKVNGGSPAERAGLIAGDSVIKINNTDVFNLRHKDAQDVIVKAGPAFEVTIQRGGSTWKPSVIPTGSLQQASAISPVTKTSLAATNQENIGAIGTGHNLSAKPFGAQVNGNVNGGPKLVNNQYNSPLKLYSEESIAETLSAQTEVLSTGALGVNFKKNEKNYDASNSAVFRMLQEAEKEPKTPEAVSPRSTDFYATQSHAIGSHRQATSPRSNTPYESNSQLGSSRLGDSPNISNQPDQQDGVATKCTDCERVIVGVFVRIKDKNLHVECFKCVTCGTSLKNVGYYNINQKLYCDVHAKLAARANQPGPNLVPVTVPPGGRAPASAISAALASHSLPSPSPLSPRTNLAQPFQHQIQDEKEVNLSTPLQKINLTPNKPNAINNNLLNNTITPLSFTKYLNKQAGSFSSAPKPFSSVSAPNYNTLPKSAPLSPIAPPSAPILAPAPPPSSFSPASSTGRSVNIVWPPPPEEPEIPTACPLYFVPNSHLKVVPKPKRAEEFCDDASEFSELEELSMAHQYQEPKLSLCSEEVCSFTDRRSAVECVETISESLQTQKLVESVMRNRPHSPPPLPAPPIDQDVVPAPDTRKTSLPATICQTCSCPTAGNLQRLSDFKPNTQECKLRSQVENAVPQQWESQMVQALRTVPGDVESFNQIPKKFSGSAFASALAIAPAEPFTAQPPTSMQPVPLPEETEPYFPPEHPVEIEPKEEKPEKPKTDSKFVKALQTAPDRPFTPVNKPPAKKKQEPADEFLRDLPKPQQKLTMREALTFASDRPYTPIQVESAAAASEVQVVEKKTKQKVENLQKPMKPATLPASFHPTVEKPQYPKPYPVKFEQKHEEKSLEKTTTIEKEQRENVVNEEVVVGETSEVQGMYPLFKGFSCSFGSKSEHSQFSVEICTSPPIINTRTSTPSVKVTRSGETSEIVKETQTTHEKSSQESKVIEKQAEEVVLKRPLPLSSALHKPQALPQYQVSLSENAEADLQLMEKIEAAKTRHEQQRTAISVPTVQVQAPSKPIITIQPGETHVHFRPVCEEKPQSKTFSPRPRPLTPSMINKPPATLPYYQANLVAQEYSAASVNLLDPASPAVSRSPSPCPERMRSPSPFAPSQASVARSKSPAEGPPPNPLLHRQAAPTQRDFKVEEAKRNLTSYIPQHRDKADLVQKAQSLAPQMYVARSEDHRQQVETIPGGSCLKVENRKSSDSMRVQQTQQGGVSTCVRERSQAAHLEQVNKSQTQSVQTSADGRVQVQRKKTVTEEFERMQKAEMIEIEKNVVATTQRHHAFKTGVQEVASPEPQWRRSAAGAFSTPPQSEAPESPSAPLATTKSAHDSNDTKRSEIFLQIGGEPSQIPCYGQINVSIPYSTSPQLDSKGSSPRSDYSSQSSSSSNKNPQLLESARDKIIAELKNNAAKKTITSSTNQKSSEPVYSQITKQPPSVVAKDLANSSPPPMPEKSLDLPDNLTFSNNKVQSGVLTKAEDDARPIIPVCCHCSKEIERGPFITALGKIWCPEHFTCSTPSCRRPLQDLGFVEERGQLYCEYCFEQYLAPPCSKCNVKIKGDCLKAIGKNFHPECFNCSYCGKLFGNSPFFLEDGSPYCEADWNEMFTTKCFACGFPVEAGDRWVEALNNNYHSQCFNCTMCKKNLEGQSFFAKGGRPFCKNHAR